MPKNRTDTPPLSPEPTPARNEIPSTSPQESLEEILARIEPRLKLILFRHRIPAQDADDILQETLLICAQKFDSIRNIEPWLLATLANRCVIYWRRTRQGIESFIDAVDTTFLENTPIEPLQLSIDSRDSMRLVMESAELSTFEISFLWLKYGLGLTNEEMAGRTGYKAVSIRKISQRIRKKLQNRLQDLGIKSVEDFFTIDPSRFKKK